MSSSNESRLNPLVHLFAAAAATVFTAGCEPELLDAPPGSELTNVDGLSEGELAEDLEGLSCERMGAWRICGPEQVQFCGYGSSGGEWYECEAADDCEAGAIEYDEYGAEYGCPVERECIDFGEGTKWYYPVCNTPLVLNFTEAPVEFTPAEALDDAAPFAAGGNEACTQTDWPTADTPWLVRDIDGDGAIEGGAELFGSGTAVAGGGKAKHGFQALAELDENRDGALDALDSGYHSLALWSDHDADRRTDEGELVTLANAGITTLSVQWESSIECDARGNCGRERASFEFVDTAGRPGLGGVGEVVDVYLRCR